MGDLCTSGSSPLSYQQLSKLVEARLDIGSMARRLAVGKVVLVLDPHRRVWTEDEDESLGSCGFFSPDDFELRVAIGYKQWPLILLHEYAHFLQWRAGCKAWLNAKDDSAFWSWIQGKRVNRERAWAATRALFMCERDAERRTIKLLGKMFADLGLIDVASYIKRANAYLASYPTMTKQRRWYKVPPYQSKKLLVNMPGDRLINWREACRHSEIA